ncbi:WhiB family transcriptional regulator [Pseudonocardia hispaniensis]|uniref:Transcriptional regulator WhiB n=1 Tax=Pseudonocardia hispaniensis TaxID=904933 RepID=A0ABW1IWL2_9PSEU
MPVRSAPSNDGAVTHQNTGGHAAAVLGNILDAVPAAGLELPCRSADADLWFADSPAVLEQAKALCGACPIRAECLAGALSREEPWGVWGGEIFERGVVIPRKRPRGRPRKVDIERDRAYAVASA